MDGGTTGRGAAWHDELAVAWIERTTCKKGSFRLEEHNFLKMGENLGSDVDVTVHGWKGSLQQARVEEVLH